MTPEEISQHFATAVGMLEKYFAALKTPTAVSLVILTPAQADTVNSQIAVYGTTLSPPAPNLQLFVKAGDDRWYQQPAPTMLGNQLGRDFWLVQGTWIGPQNPSQPALTNQYTMMAVSNPTAPITDIIVKEDVLYQTGMDQSAQTTVQLVKS